MFTKEYQGTSKCVSLLQEVMLLIIKILARWVTILWNFSSELY